MLTMQNNCSSGSLQACRVGLAIPQEKANVHRRKEESTIEGKALLVRLANQGLQFGGKRRVNDKVCAGHFSSKFPLQWIQY